MNEGAGVSAWQVLVALAVGGGVGVLLGAVVTELDSEDREREAYGRGWREGLARGDREGFERGAEYGREDAFYFPTEKIRDREARVKSGVAGLHARHGGRASERAEGARGGAAVVPHATVGVSVTRAPRGGARGANGEWYEGGKFVAATDRPKGQGRRARPARAEEVEAGVREVPPAEGMRPIWSQVAGVYRYDRAVRRFGEAPPAWRAYVGEERARELDALRDRWNVGERWYSLAGTVAGLLKGGA
jgi:hypothetical protein